MCKKNKENKNTVKFYEYNEKDFSIVMELCDENLSTMIRNKNQIFTFCEIREILNQLNNSFKIMNEKNLKINQKKIAMIIKNWKKK